MEEIADHRHDDARLAAPPPSSPAFGSVLGQGQGQIRYEDDEDEGHVCRICRNPGVSFVEHVQTYLTQLSLDATKPLLSFKKGHSFTLLSAILIDGRLLLFIVINLGSTA